ncbi:hypothetical protein B0H13DRAFT_2349849 [Mycena leptocephala]|nr:hypothetical protein B0H13DRAFT_2349849 [Mycena leptocephala]
MHHWGFKSEIGLMLVDLGMRSDKQPICGTSKQLFVVLDPVINVVGNSKVEAHGRGASPVYSSIPALPDNPEGWSPNTNAAFEVLGSAYTHALGVLLQERGDPVRYKLVSSNIVDNMIPILERMDVDGVPRHWIETCAFVFGPLVYELQVSAVAAEGVERDDIELLEPVSQTRSGKTGCPRKDINPAYLAEATASGRNIKKSALATALNVHRHTLRKRLVEQGLNTKFDTLDDHELDSLTHEFKAKKPTSGLRYLRGHLRTHGVRVQKERVRHLLKRVDGLGQALRTRLAIKRR